ncbi:CARDB domain-containing protein, partial [Corallococcus terminator]
MSQAHSVLNGPDLVVTRIQAPPSLQSGNAFTAKVTVCNTGSVATTSAAQSLRLYLSNNATQQLPPSNGPLPFGQTEAGRTNVARLVSGECITQDVNANVTLPYPGTAGTYFLGAFIDVAREEAEQDENNNGFVSGRMDVGSRPDLVVTRLDAPAGLKPGQSFTATATVCNQGTTSASASSVELYLSTRDTLVLPSSGPGARLPLQQSSLGTAPTSPLGAGHCAPAKVSGQVVLPQAAVTNQPLYLGAAVNPSLTTLELRQDNNLFVSGLVSVGHEADLTVSSVTAPSSLRPGEPFTPSVKVCNVGPSVTYSFDVAVFLSTVPSLTAPSATRIQVGTQSLPSLEGGRCVTTPVPANFQLPEAATGDQPLYVGAVVDPTQGMLELREDNNALVGGPVGVGQGPDLELASLQGPASLEAGQAFTAQAKVCNVGTQPSPPSQVRLFLATNPTL